MVITGRAVAVVALVRCTVPLVRPQWSTFWLYLVVMVAVLAIDLVRAAPPQDVALSRSGDTTVRAGETRPH